MHVSSQRYTVLRRRCALNTAVIAAGFAALATSMTMGCGQPDAPPTRLPTAGAPDAPDQGDNGDLPPRPRACLAFPAGGDSCAAPDATTPSTDHVPVPSEVPAPQADDTVPVPNVPAGPTAHVRCAGLPAWDEASVALEAEVLRLVNVARQRGADCGTRGVFAPAGPLTLAPQLTCAARAHAEDMGENDYFSHQGTNGSAPGERAEKAGYAWTAIAENIAAGAPTPAAVVHNWLTSDGHCANIMGPDYTELGTGHFDAPNSTYGVYWVQDFGVPADDRSR